MINTSSAHGGRAGGRAVGVIKSKTAAPTAGGGQYQNDGIKDGVERVKRFFPRHRVNTRGAARVGPSEQKKNIAYGTTGDAQPVAGGECFGWWGRGRNGIGNKSKRSAGKDGSMFFTFFHKSRELFGKQRPKKKKKIFKKRKKTS